MANNTDWLNISQNSGGTGVTPLSLTALTNNTLSAKTATVTAKNTTYNVSGTTTVTIQGFVPTLTLSRSTVRFDSTGGTATFTVYSNTAWTITFPAIVQSYSVSAGTGDTEVTIALGPNPDEVAKIDTGIVKDCFNINQLYLTVVQESFIAELTVTPDDDIIFVNTGSSTSVTIETNTNWEIECPNWVTPSIVSGESGTTTVTFTAGQNGNTDRSGVITIYAGSKYVEINVFQPFYIPPYITVTPSAWTFNYTEDGKTFVVDSYPEWTADIISTGETIWGSDCFIEATYSIPSAMTMNLFMGYSGDVSAVYFNAVRQYTNNIYFPSSGTYKVRFEIACEGRAPILNDSYIVSLEERGTFRKTSYAVGEYESVSGETTYILCIDGTVPAVSAYTEDGDFITMETYYMTGSYYSAATFNVTGRIKITFVFDATSLRLSTGSYFTGDIDLKKLELGNGFVEVKFASLAGGVTSLTMNEVVALNTNFNSGARSVSEIVCKMPESPISGGDFQASVAYNGTLYYPAGSDYTAFLAALNYDSNYNWIGQEI